MRSEAKPSAEDGRTIANECMRMRPVCGKHNSLCRGRVQTTTTLPSVRTKKGRIESGLNVPVTTRIPRLGGGMKLIRHHLANNMYTEEDYLASMGRRRALEEPRASSSEKPSDCQQKADLNANSMSVLELLRPDQIKDEPTDSSNQMENESMNDSDSQMRVIGQVVKIDPAFLPGNEVPQESETEDVALDLSQQRSSPEPEFEEALDLSTTRERREYRPETALDLSKKSTSITAESETTVNPPEADVVLPTKEVSTEEPEARPQEAAEEAAPQAAPVLEAPPVSPLEISENSPPEEVEETKNTQAILHDRAPEFVCEICKEPCASLTDLGKHTLDHVKAVKQQQARIKKAEQEQRKTVQQKKKQEKANQRSNVSTPLKEVPVLNTTVEQTPPTPPPEKPLKSKVTATKTQKSQVLPSPVRDEQFQCHLCKTAFVTMRALGLHNRTHPKCKVCNKQLADKDALKAHECPESEKKQNEVAQSKQAKLISWLMLAAKRNPKKANLATVSKAPEEATAKENSESPTAEAPQVPAVETEASEVNPPTATESKAKSNNTKCSPTKTSKRRGSREDKAKTADIDTISSASSNSNKSEKKAPAKKEKKRKSPPRQVREVLQETDVASPTSTVSEVTVESVVPKKRKRTSAKAKMEETAQAIKQDPPPGLEDGNKGSSKRKDKSQKPESVELDRASLASGSSESAADENNPVSKKKRKTQPKVQWIQLETVTKQEPQSTEPPAKKKKTLHQKENDVASTPVIPDKQEPKKKANKVKSVPPKAKDTTSALSEIIPSQDPPSPMETVDESDDKKKIVAPGRTTNPRGRPRKSATQPLSKEELTCKACGNAFGNIGLLKNHIRSHRWQNPHICGSCGLVFKSALEVKEHNKLHNANKPFKCNECDSAFTRRFFLELHLRSHTGEKPFNCELCNKSFAQSSQLKIHTRIHMGDKPNKCTVCDATFVMASKLKDHMRIHSGDRPFACEQCGKTFAQAYYLKIHLRTHSGAKPFKCTVCGTGFRQSCHVVIHMRTHTKENPYACSDCGMTFRHSPVLKKHKENGCEGKINPIAKQEIKA